MNPYKATLCISALLLLFLSCNDHSTSESSPSYSYSSSGCVGSGLGKKQNGTYADSMFTYLFHAGMLDLSFSVIAPCNHLANSLLVQQAIHDDTIDVSVIDTIRSVARCSCLFMVSLQNIPANQDHYKVRCTYQRSADSLTYLLHFADVIWQNS